MLKLSDTRTTLRTSYYLPDLQTFSSLRESYYFVDEPSDIARLAAMLNGPAFSCTYVSMTTPTPGAPEYILFQSSDLAWYIMSAVDDGALPEQVADRGKISAQSLTDALYRMAKLLDD